MKLIQIKLQRFLPVLLLLIIVSCSKNEKANQVVVGLESDIQTLNPLYIMSEAEANISELIFLSLVGHDWNSEKGEPISFPVLASKIEWGNDSSSVVITLKNEVKWENGSEFTVDDIIFSFDLYSDKKVESRFYGTFYNYYLNKDLSINLAKTFEVINPHKLKIYFLPNRNVTYYDFDLPILPKYLFEKYDRNELATTDKIKISGGTGAYKVKEFNKSQNVKLSATSTSIFSKPDQIEELVFKIVPDYTSRIFQLKNGDIDITEYIKPEDLQELNNLNTFLIKQRKGREYDYLGLKVNFDKVAKKKAEGLFDSQRIRMAIAKSINRESIIKEYLLGNGELMSNPVSPIFTSLNTNSVPIPYNIAEAKAILDSEGWADSNNDGQIEKKGIPFSFTLSFPTNNTFREYAAIRIQNNLKAVGIGVKLQALEPAVFFEKMFNKELEAWLAGWSVPVPLNLKPYWHSDPNIAQGNISSYKNAEVDRILDKLDMRLLGNNRGDLIRELQKIISADQPVIFLYWINNSVAINSRIQNVKVSPLATIQKCWEWKIN